MRQVREVSALCCIGTESNSLDRHLQASAPSSRTGRLADLRLSMQIAPIQLLGNTAGVAATIVALICVYGWQAAAREAAGGQPWAAAPLLDTAFNTGAHTV